MNYTRKTPQKSSIPYNTTGYHDNSITSPIEVAISRITVNFGKISQNTLNFTARVHLDAVQKSNFLGGGRHE